MPVYAEKEQIDGQKRWYIRTYVTDENGKSKQITRHNKNWIGREGKKEAEWEENRLKNSEKCIIEKKSTLILSVDDAFNELKKDDILYNRNSESTRKTYEYRYQKHIKPSFGSKNIFNITMKDINKLIDTLKITKKKYKDEYLDVVYINSIIELMERIYSFITNKYEIKPKLKFVKIRKNRDEIPIVSLNDLIKENMSLSPDDWKKFCKAMEKEIKLAKGDIKDTLLKLSLLFACEYILLVRVGESQAMKFKNLISDSNIYLLYEQWSKPLNKLTPLKNRKARLLYMSQNMVKLFQNIYEYFHSKYGISEDDFIFRSIDNNDRPISRTTIDRYRKLICKKAGINYTTNHEFRHAGISNAMYNEVDMSAISDMAGHTKEVMLSTYVQTLKKANSDLINTLNNIYLPSELQK